MNQKEISAASIEQKKNDAIYKQIQMAMMKNEFPPGTVMSERKISERFGVSRSPAREALKRFVLEGLMDQTESGRIVIAPVTREDIEEVYNMLEHVEPYAARLCAERVEPQMIEDFEGVLERMRTAIREGDREAQVWADFDFHAMIAHFAGLRRSLNALMSLCAQRIRIMNSIGDQNPKLSGNSIREHEGIVRAIAKGDGVEAEQRVRLHLYSVKFYYLEQFDIQKLQEI